MVSAVVWTLLLLAGFASCTPEKRPEWLPDRPDWWPDWWPANWDRPDWWPIDSDGQLVTPEWWPDNCRRPVWWPIGDDGEWLKPDWENWVRPEWWPFGPDGEFVKPEWWPENWERPEWWPIMPDGGWERPEWWPIGPDGEFVKPEWWPVGPDGEWITPDWWPEEWERPEWWPINPEGEWVRPDWLPEIQLPNYVPRERGSLADITEYPGIVQVEVGYGPLWIQGCAGSVLTSLHILTAARCFSGCLFDERFRRIRAGTSTRRVGGDIVGIQNVYNHPDFGSNQLDSDITVLKLQTGLVYGATIQQTPIIAQGISMGAGIAVKFVGWGTTAEGSILGNRNLYKIDLVLTSREACAERYSKTPLPIVVSEKMICAAQPGSAGRDGDIRDVGAPLYYDNILVGVTSFSVRPGNASYPVLATAVSSFTNWIVANAV